MSTAVRSAPPAPAPDRPHAPGASNSPYGALVLDAFNAMSASADNNGDKLVSGLRGTAE